MVGPAISGAASGNVYQSAVSYGLSYGVKKSTGKSLIENVIDLGKVAENTKEIQEHDILINSYR